MNDYDLIKKYLETEERARRFKHRDRAIVNIVFKEFYEIALVLKDVKKERIVEFAHRIQSIARTFRKVMEDNPDWWQEDEKQAKIITEQQAILDLGYEVNYHQDIKKLKTL